MGGTREGGSTGVSAELPGLTGMASNGLNLQTGRPLSYAIWKTLFQNADSSEIQACLWLKESVVMMRGTTSDTYIDVE